MIALRRGRYVYLIGRSVQDVVGPRRNRPGSSETSKIRYRFAGTGIDRVTKHPRLFLHETPAFSVVDFIGMLNVRRSVQSVVTRCAVNASSCWAIAARVSRDGHLILATLSRMKIYENFALLRPVVRKYIRQRYLNGKIAIDRWVQRFSMWKVRECAITIVF